MNISPVVVMHVLLFISSASIAFGTFTNTLFGWHPFTMSLGYLFFMAEGLLSAVAFRHVDAGAERVRGIDAHMAMQLRAVVLICIGAGTIIYNKVCGFVHHRQGFLRDGDIDCCEWLCQVGSVRCVEGIADSFSGSLCRWCTTSITSSHCMPR